MIACDFFFKCFIEALHILNLDLKVDAAPERFLVATQERLLKIPSIISWAPLLSSIANSFSGRS